MHPPWMREDYAARQGPEVDREGLSEEVAPNPGRIREISWEHGPASVPPIGICSETNETERQSQLQTAGEGKDLGSGSSRAEPQGRKKSARLQTAQQEPASLGPAEEGKR